MAHEKVFGICENKCKVEVVPKEQLLNLIYPVGSIYMSVNSIDPSILFGGTWVSWGSGRVPVGVNPSDSTFATVEKTGGEKEHKLTVEEIPKHGHPMEASALSLNESTVGHAQSGSGMMAFTSIGSVAGTIKVGSDTAHNNLQPYITCYMWKRTA